MEIKVKIATFLFIKGKQDALHFNIKMLENICFKTVNMFVSFILIHPQPNHVNKITCSGR